ncbi:MAG: hypothetical protein WCX16_01330 [Candidatus Omnitrophota bacterium]
MKFILILLIVAMVGCQSTSVYKKEEVDVSSREETPGDVRSAVESVAGAVSKKPARVKYCPICGRRFSPSVVQCPVDGADLKELE